MEFSFIKIKTYTEALRKPKLNLNNHTLTQSKLQTHVMYTREQDMVTGKSLSLKDCLGLKGGKTVIVCLCQTDVNNSYTL